MKIGELAARARVSVRALRYYEDRGLLRSGRTPGGQREYDDDALDRVLFIRQLFAAGLASRTIVSILPCLDSGGLSADQRELLVAEVRTIEGQIAELAQARDRLTHLIAQAAEREPVPA
jgi:DNA-binding transcriptional MerR regulator